MESFHDSMIRAYALIADHTTPPCVPAEAEGVDLAVARVEHELEMCSCYWEMDPRTAEPSP